MASVGAVTNSAAMSMGVRGSLWTGVFVFVRTLEEESRRGIAVCRVGPFPMFCNLQTVFHRNLVE